MNKKILTACIISASAVLLSACDPKSTGTTGNTSDIDSATNSDYSITQSDTETIGACDVTTKAAVETATNLTVLEPKSTGVQDIMGSKGETCIYAFDEIGLTNSFYVDVEQFATQEELDESKEYSGFGNMKAVAGVGDEAYFQSSDTLLNTTEHVLKVLKGTKKYSLSISQPTSSTNVTSEAAEKALLDIAKTATF